MFQWSDLYCTLGLPARKLQLTFSVAYAITFTTAAFLKSASALLYPDHIRTFMPPRPTPTPQRWAPELFHARTNSRTLFSSSPHNTSFHLPLPTSLAVCSPDCVLNHEHVLATQPSNFLETVKVLSGHAPPSSHIAVSSQRLPQSHSHTVTRHVCISWIATDSL
jgi:hypothetical protein